MTGPRLLGRSALITGASRGLGLATAIAFSREGGDIVLVGRDAAALDLAAAEVNAARARSHQRVRMHAVDVTDLAAMDDVTASWLETAADVRVLVNNAAIQGPIGELGRVGWDAWRHAIDVDLLAPARLCHLVVPHMQAAGAGKIISVSGGGATSPRARFSAYATAKCGLVRFSETLAAELAGTGVDVNTVAPGAMNTRMLDAVLAAGTSAGIEYERALAQQASGGTSPDRAAELMVFLASAASDGITGRLISAVWDPWEHLPAHRDELDRSDVYTLRRVVPKDRGMTWGER